jgi:polycomb protein EED
VYTVLSGAGRSVSCVAMAEYVFSFHPEPFLLTLEQPISSIAVHPRVPSYICTTSSDQTARIYDLDKLPDAVEKNPFWLPGTGPSKAGAPHGLRSSEREEWGKGLCTTILVGGRSGGHLAAVTCAAFHSTFPLIATGGVKVQLPWWHF